MNMEKLKQRAEEFKAPIEEMIERTKEADLAFISSKEELGLSAQDLEGLRLNLDRIARAHKEIRLIDEFVEYWKKRGPIDN